MRAMLKRSTTHRTAGVAVGVAVLLLAGQASATTTTFTDTTPGETAYSIPSGTVSLQVTVVGASASNAQRGGVPPGPAGAGAEVLATIRPPAGVSTLYLEVGTGGGSSAYGALGGGESAIQTCSLGATGCIYTANPTTDPRLVVAGGGGGGGENSFATGVGGTGGSAGAASYGPPGAGGSGTSSGNGFSGGWAGLQVNAVAGAAGAPSGSCGSSGAGGIGSAGYGGAGGDAGGGNDSSGGGGGGGWMGGSGGGAGDCGMTGGSGGGGGAGTSFIESAATSISICQVGASGCIPGGRPEIVIVATISALDGGSCSTNADCASGHCLGSVCCTTACTTGGACDATTCDSTGKCLYPTTQCSPQSCAGGVQSNASFCPGTGGACPAATTTSCGLYTCAGSACGTSCASDADCSGAWCDETTHTCTAPAANGMPVGSDPAHSSPTLDGTCTASAGALTCASGVCDTADNLCGYANFDGPCTTSNGATVCRSGACSATGTCEPAGGCNVDADCTRGFWCNETAHMCSPQLANGVAIPSDPPHTSPTLNGMCTAAAGTLVCLSGVCDRIDNACGYANGDGLCDSTNGALVCRSGACSVDFMCVMAGGCNVDGDCTSSAAPVCDVATHTCVAMHIDAGLPDGPVVRDADGSPDAAARPDTPGATREGGGGPGADAVAADGSPTAGQHQAGCSCEMTSRAPRSNGTWALVMLGVGLMVGRRRSRKRPGGR